MDRVASKTLAAAAVILLLAASPAPGETGKERSPAQGAAKRDRKGIHHLDEVRILGSVEHPGVLFFLPRAKFRLLPVREEHDWRERILRDDRDKEEIPE
mgnify:CR=1 FL=1